MASTIGRAALTAALIGTRPLAMLSGRSIDVDLNALRSTADHIDAFCDTLNDEMGSANKAVVAMLKGHWTGLDATEFGNHWDLIFANSSNTIRFRESLRNYANALRACVQLYESTQAMVLNSAGNRLRRAAGR